jgi:transcription elongation factor
VGVLSNNGIIKEEKENKMKFKVGDEVRITKKISSHDFNIGDIVKIVDTDEQDNLQYFGARSGEYLKFGFSGLECESITNSYDIHITSNGVYTNCLYKKNGEIVSSSSAKLNQDSSDVFDIKEGARLCIERLSSDKAKRAVCIKSKNNAKDIWTLGKIYEFKDGRMLRDDKIWSSKYKSLEEMNERLKNVKFVELKED